MRIRPRTVARIALKGFGKPPRRRKGSIDRYLDSQMALARKIAESRHIDNDTKSRLLEAQHVEMDLLTSFLFSAALGFLGAFVMWALFRNGTVALLGWVILGLVLFVVFVRVQEGSRKASVYSDSGASEGNAEMSGEDEYEVEYGVYLPPWQY